MKLVISTVRFQCVVRVLVPKHLSLSDERLLARKLAVARIQIADQSPPPPTSRQSTRNCVRQRPARQARRIGRQPKSKPSPRQRR